MLHRFADWVRALRVHDMGGPRIVETYAILCRFNRWIRTTSLCGDYDLKLTHKLANFIKQKLDHPLDMALMELSAEHELHDAPTHDRNSKAYSELARALYR